MLKFYKRMLNAVITQDTTLLGYYLRRIASALFTVILISTLTFAMMHSIPGGPFTREKAVPAEILRTLNEKYNLDAPLPEQYFDYMLGLLKFDLGPSFSKIGTSVLAEVMGQPEKLQGIDPTPFVTEQHGLPTITDVLRELEKPGRDPRPEFRTAQFRPDVQSPADLRDNMVLEGVVTNVTNFGAFVDVGVHQDGLVHISELGSGFVNDPQQVVKPGQIVQVRVIGVDQERKRISLSLRLNPAEAPARAPRRSGEDSRRERPDGERRPNRDARRREEARPERREQDRPRREERPRNDRPAREPASEPKIGSLGALLQQAGLRKGNG